METNTLIKIALKFTIGLMVIGIHAANAQSPGDELSRQKISALSGGFSGPLTIEANLGHAVVAIGDIDCDGIEDMVVGAPGSNNGRGEIWTLFMNSDGTVRNQVLTSLDTYLDINDWFGCSIAFLGDLDGAGPARYALAVGAYGDDDIVDQGAIYILFFDETGAMIDGGISYDGTDTHLKISPLSPQLPASLDFWGYSIAVVGDIDGNGVADLAVGEPFGDDGGNQTGGVWILFLNTNGTVSYTNKISATSGGFVGALNAFDHFGWSIAEVNDLDGNGVPDVAIGATGDDDGGIDRGAIWILFLNSDGSVSYHQKISTIQGNFTGDVNVGFGNSCGNLNDLNRDSLQDLAIGSVDPEGVWLLFLNVDGTVISHNFVASSTANVNFGGSVAAIGDTGNDGFPEIAIGAERDDDCGLDKGAVWIVSLFIGDPANPNERTWINPVGGDYNIASNWFPTGVPPITSPVLFSLNETYQANFNNNIENTQIHIRSGDVTFNLGGNSYSVGSPFGPSFVVGKYSGDNASLLIVEGEFLCVNGLIGKDSGSVGSVTVSGNGISLTNLLATSLRLGHNGNGSLNINNGALVGTNDIFLGGTNCTSWGELFITDPGSQLDVFQFLDVHRGLITVINGGALSAPTSTIQIFNEGAITGDGTIISNILNYGSVAPGNPLGTLTINGDYNQSSPLYGLTSGLLEIELGALSKDVLNVSNLATLGGGLVVDLVNGFEPGPGETFDVLNSSSLAGQFDIALLPGLSNGNYMLVQTGTNAGAATTVTLVIQTLNNLVDIGLPGELVDIVGVPTDVAVGDLDGDGSIDTAITLSGSPGSVLLLFNDGTGGFASSTQITLGNEPSAIAIGNLDAGTDKDIVVTNAVDGTVSMLYNDGFGGFSSTTVMTVGTNPTDVEIANFDQVNGNDLVVVNNGDNEVHILFNDGGALPDFAVLPPEILFTDDNPLDVNPEDIDQDKLSLVDLAVTNKVAGTVQVFQNGGLGTFNAPINLVVDNDPTRIELADLDGNTFPDIVTTNTASGTVSIILNNGAFSFAPAVNLPLGDNPRSVSIVDLDADADLDIAVVANNALGNAVVMVLRNDTPGIPGGILTLTQSDELGEGDNPVLVIAGDVDGDTDEDLITINSSSAAPGAPRSGGGGSGGGDRGVLNFMRVHPNNIIQSCAADITGDGTVNVLDLLELVNLWGPCPAGCQADVNGDNVVNVVDLLSVIDQWGPC